MIILFVLDLVKLVIGFVTSLIPQATKLPAIGGYDIDGALVAGIGQLHQFSAAFWPLTYLFQAFLVLMGYYIIKLTIRLLLGSRTPTD